MGLYKNHKLQMTESLGRVDVHTLSKDLNMNKEHRATR